MSSSPREHCSESALRSAPKAFPRAAPARNGEKQMRARQVPGTPGSPSPLLSHTHSASSPKVHCGPGSPGQAPPHPHLVPHAGKAAPRLSPQQSVWQGSASWDVRKETFSAESGVQRGDANGRPFFSCTMTLLKGEQQGTAFSPYSQPSFRLTVQSGGLLLSSRDHHLVGWPMC